MSIIEPLEARTRPLQDILIVALTDYHHPGNVSISVRTDCRLFSLVRTGGIMWYHLDLTIRGNWRLDSNQDKAGLQPATYPFSHPGKFCNSLPC